MCMVQVCIYRNSVRRALKSIAQALEQLETSQTGAAETAQVACAVMTVVTQIAQSLHRLQIVSLCHVIDLLHAMPMLLLQSVKASLRLLSHCTACKS